MPGTVVWDQKIPTRWESSPRPSVNCLQNCTGCKQEQAVVPTQKSYQQDHRNPVYEASQGTEISCAITLMEGEVTEVMAWTERTVTLSEPQEYV